MSFLPGITPRRAASARRKHPARRSTVLALTLALSLTTAFALLGAGSALSQPPLAVPRTEQQREVVDRFYDAVNVAIRTGETALDEVVAPDLVTHDARSRVDQDRTAFDRHLATLHAADPALHLAVEAVLIEGDRAAVRVLARSARTGPFLGMQLDGRIAPWPAIELLRLAGGAVVERWAIDDAGIVLQPVLDARLDVPAADPGSVGVARITLAPGASVSKVVGTAAVHVAIDRGALRVRANGEGVRITDGGQIANADGRIEGRVDRVLRPGAAVFVLGDVPLELRNAGDTAAVAMVVAPSASLATPGAVLRGVRLAGQGRDAKPIFDWAPGVAVEPLAWGANVSTAPGPIAVAVGRVTLGPRACLPPHAVAAVETIAVEAGRLGLAASGPMAVIAPRDPPIASPDRAGEPAVIVGESEIVLTSTRGAVLFERAVVSLCNPDAVPATALVGTLAPAGLDRNGGTIEPDG